MACENKILRKQCRVRGGIQKARVDFPEADIRRAKCHKKCGTCNSSLFAAVEGNPLRSRNGEELYLRLAKLPSAAGKTLAVC